MDTEEFIRKARELHGDRYIYSKINYIKSKDKVIITCPIHGDFEIFPNSHLKGKGCSHCAKSQTSKSLSLTQDEAESHVAVFLEGSNVVLNSPFIYDTMRRTKLELRCRVHDVVWTINFHNTYTDTFSGCHRCRAVYSKEVCAKEALKYKTKSEFGKKSKGAYFAAMRNGWLDEICSHMQVQGNLYKRCIYAYEFYNINNNNYVYVGLTQNIHQRHLQHQRKGSVYRFCKEMHIDIPEPIVLTDYNSKEEAAILEGRVLKSYIDKGWLQVNKAKTGGLGGNNRYQGLSFEECKNIGNKYKRRSQWKKYDYQSYYAATLNGWIDQILPQNSRYGNAKQVYWTKERIYNVALQYEYFCDFRKNEPSAYAVASKKGWIEDTTSHLIRKKKNTNFTLEIILAEIEKYDNLSSFIEECPQMYAWLQRKKIKFRDITDKKFRDRKTNSKKIYQYTIDGELVRSYKSAREATSFGFDYKKISAVCTGKRKSHKGYTFSFLEKE